MILTKQNPLLHKITESIGPELRELICKFLLISSILFQVATQ